jgi:Na+/H+ antiporter NhaD/arsenite permease-like protein
MKRHGISLTCVFLAILLAAGACWGQKPQPEGAVLIVQGKVLDSADLPLSDATVLPFLNGKPFLPRVQGGGTPKEYSTGRNGLFMIEIPAPAEKIKDGKWSLKITRPSFRPSEMIPLKALDEGVNEKGVRTFLSVTTVSLARYQGTAFWIALIVFLVMYGLIAFEVLHRALAALLSAAVLLLITHSLGSYDDAFKILTWHQAIHAVDWNVIFLLMGMMIIVGVLKVSGVFQWLAYKCFEVSKGQVFALCSALCIVTATASAFLDNVTTMIFITPITMEIAVALGISPVVLLVPEILASNFGGTATLIGDPPNIMIGSFAGITFNQFVIHLTPVVIVVMAAQILYNKLYYGRDYAKARVDDVPAMINFLRQKYPITDRRVLKIGGSVMLGAIVLFIFHGYLHMEVSVAALFGAAVVILLNRMDIVELLEKEIEWPSLMFFIMLFMVVGGAEQTGILQALADWMLTVCQGNLTVAVLVILWVSGIAAGIVGSIPCTAALLTVTAYLTKTIPGGESGVLWWALSLGACFGGNATIIASAANVVTAGLAERAGYEITFFQFLKEAAPITIISLIISSAFLLLRY